MNDFERRSAFVTGGATGIGFACAQALLDRGADVLICGHQARQVSEADSRLKRGTGRLWSHVADVRDMAALEAAAGELLRHTGRIDHLVCAAGVQIPGTALTASEADWLTVLDVNLSGAFRACKTVLPCMTRNGRGSIVIVSSVQAMLGKRNGVAYVATKGGLNAMARAMALDHAPQGVRVNVVCPGVVDTPMLHEAAHRAAPSADVDDTVRQWARSQPLGESIGEPCNARDVADTVAFLLSDSARYVTGAEFRVDGGLAAKLAMG